MPIIYCALDMFSVSQAIRIVQDDKTTITVYASAADVPSVIAELCKEKNITDVHYYGNEQYLEQIVKDTETNYNLHYHCGNPLNIEVN